MWNAIVKRTLLSISFLSFTILSLQAQRSPNLGSLDPFADELTINVRSVRLSDNKVLITWLDNTSSGSNNLKVVVGSISGTDITYGTTKTIHSNVFLQQHGLVAFSSEKAVIVYEANLATDISKYSILEIDGIEVSVSNTATFVDGPQFQASKTIDAVALSNNTIVACYERDLADDQFEVVSGSLDGNTITWGTPKSPNGNDDASHANIVRMSSSKFAIAYEDNRVGAANGDEGMVVVGEVASNVVTLGTAESYASTSDVQVTRLTALSESELILVQEYDVTNDFGQAHYVTVSGTDVIFPGGTAPTFYLTEGVDDISVDALSKTEFLIAVDGGSTDASTVYTGIVSSNNISLTSGTNIYIGQADDITVSALTSDLVVLAFTNDNGVSTATTDRGEGLVVTFSATTNPEINVQGNSTSILSGDDSPSSADHTDFGTGGSLSRTFTIQNQGTGTLTLGSNAVTITGSNAADFSVNTQPATSVSGNGSTTFIIDFSSAVTSTRTAEIHINSDDLHESDYFFTIEAVGGASAPSSATVAATVFLQGAWNGSSAMNTTINGSIPSAHPYSGSDYNNHTGSENASAPAIAVDWVLVELREAGTAAGALNSTKVGSVAGFLMSDGSIVATDGTSDLTISLSGNSGADFFVVVYHRNHLPIMSASAVSESSGTYTIDLTASANVYNAADAVSTLTGSSKVGMHAGDLDQDGDVDATDLSSWRANNGVTFSYGTNGEADLNLDGVINAIDRNEFHQKNTTKTRQVPSS